MKSVPEILHLFISKETLLLVSVRVKISPRVPKIMIPLERKLKECKRTDGEEGNYIWLIMWALQLINSHFFLFQIKFYGSSKQLNFHTENFWGFSYICNFDVQLLNFPFASFIAISIFLHLFREKLALHLKCLYWQFKMLFQFTPVRYSWQALHAQYYFKALQLQNKNDTQ